MKGGWRQIVGWRLMGAGGVGAVEYEERMEGVREGVWSWHGRASETGGQGVRPSLSEVCRMQMKMKMGQDESFCMRTRSTVHEVRLYIKMSPESRTPPARYAL